MRLSREKIQRMIDAGGGSSSGGGGGSDIAGGVTQAWVNQNYVSIEFFRKVFKVWAAGETSSDPDVEIMPNDITTTVKDIQAQAGLWTEAFLSALGQGSGGGTGGATTLDQLDDVVITSPTNGQALIYNATSQMWVNGTIQSGTDMATVWSALAAATNEQINASHLSGVLADYVTATSLQTILGDYLTQTAADQRYITIAYFDRLFRAYNGDTLVSHNDTTTTIDNIKAMFGFWTEQYISALGRGTGGSTAMYLSSLADVLLTSPQNGQALVYDSAAHKWVNGNVGGIADMTTVWAALAASTNEQINISHLSDACDGSYLKISRYTFLGASSTNLIDLNDITTVGTYAQYNDATAQYVSNKPITSNYSFRLIVERTRNTDNYLRQRFQAYNSHVVYERRSNNSGSFAGSTWQRVQGNLDDYLLLSGGTMTGALTASVLSSDATRIDYGINFGDAGHIGANSSVFGIYSIGSIVLRPNQTLGHANTNLGVSISSTDFTYNNQTIWHAGNDGAESGLDADLLDGLHADSFFKKYYISKKLVGAGWYRVANLTTYSNSFILAIGEAYNNGNPTPAVFIVNTGYTNATITQVGRAVKDPSNIEKIRLVRYNNGRFHVDVYFRNTNASGNTERINISNLGTESSLDGITMIDWTLISEIESGETVVAEATISENFNADTADKLSTARTIWGQSFDGTADVSGILNADGGILVPSNKTIKIGNAYLSYDSTNNAIRVSANEDGTGVANFYSMGAVTALGAAGGGGQQLDLASLADVLLTSPSNGQALVYNNGKWVNQTIQSGTDMATVWTNLAANTNEQINISHLTTALSDYLPLAGGTITGTNRITFGTAANVSGAGGITWGGNTIIGGNTAGDIGVYADNSIYLRPDVDNGYDAGMIIGRDSLTYNGNDMFPPVRGTYVSTAAARWTIFATIPANTTARSNDLTVLIQGVGYYYTGQMTGSWIVECRTNNSGTPTMQATCLSPKGSSGTVTFGYYIDTTANLIYFGVYTSTRRGYINVVPIKRDNFTILSTPTVLTAEPAGWTAIETRTYVSLADAQTISATKTFSAQQAFTVAQGTSPFTVASSTVVSNLNADLLDGQHASDFAAATDLNDYLPLTGGTLTGMLQVNAPIFGYNYTNSDNTASFIFDKHGNNYSGIGSTTEQDEIYLGACNLDGTWVPNYSQKWYFKGEIRASGSIQAESVKIEQTNEINSYSGLLHLNFRVATDLSLGYGGGNVGIGTTTPSYRLHVDGTIYATGAVTALSDARKKDVLRDAKIGVEQIADAPAVQFLWKGERAKEGLQVGTLAQYWQTVLPEVVMDKGGELSMQYGVAALVSAIVTARKVVDHEQRITELEKENERLRIEIEQLRLN